LSHVDHLTVIVRYLLRGKAVGKAVERYMTFVQIESHKAENLVANLVMHFDTDNRLHGLPWSVIRQCKQYVRPVFRNAGKDEGNKSIGILHSLHNAFIESCWIECSRRFQVCASAM